MIKYGLKLWSNNTHLFDEFVLRYKKNEFDFVEIYSNSEFEHNYRELEKLRDLSVLGVHMGHLDKAGFHTFYLTEVQKKPWQMTVELADFLDSPRIIVHPAVEHNWDSFQENLKKIDDPRILIESMPAKSPLDDATRIFGTSLEDLKKIKTIKEICLDIIKFIKACKYHNISYKEYIEKALQDLQPQYFHISGGNFDDPVDQHNNIWEGNCDWKWIRENLVRYSDKKDIYLVFETPKVGENLDNDIKNIEYFKNAI